MIISCLASIMKNQLSTNNISSGTIDPYFLTTKFPQVFTEPEAAQWLRISRITLQRIRLRGEISFSRIGGTRVVYTVKNLADYVQARERKSHAT